MTSPRTGLSLRDGGAVAAALLVVALAAPARAGLESAPNFRVPKDVAPAVRAEYEAAVAAFHRASEAEEDATRIAEEAAEALRKVAARAPRFAPPRYYLGIIYQWTKEFRRARTVLHQAIQLNPRFHEALVELGDTYLWLQKPDRAAVYYQKAIETAPGYALAYIRQSQLLLRQGELEHALAVAKKAGDAAASAGEARDQKNARALLKILEREARGPGWSPTFVGTSKHYEIRTPVSQDFADRVAAEAERIHGAYRGIFPEVRRRKHRFVVEVHASREEYQKAGGRKTAGGHYSPLLRKLVLFRYAKEQDTFLVLHHEAFHQFMHDYLEDAPQWFDEGLGDFFGPSEYQVVRDARGNVVSKGMRIRTNPWRLKTIKKAIQAGRIRDWRKLMLMSQRELYDRKWAGIHYAEAWSIIYFLVRHQAPKGKVAGPYFKLLDRYFQRLRKGDGQKEAFDASFGRQDVPALERAWKLYIRSLPAS